MKVDTDSLIPGMVLSQDLLGKSGNPIVEKDTVLTDIHIKFINHFLFTEVEISKLNDQISTNQEITSVKETAINQTFKKAFESAVREYEKLFNAWQNQVPFSMYEIREIFIPLFEQTIKEPLQSVLLLSHQPTSFSNICYRSCWMSIFTVYLSNHLKFEKKDWLQIGFSALLSDSGKAKMDIDVVTTKEPFAEWRLHPIYSYKLVEKEQTLTNNAKMAILQHHEYLDGSGFPAQPARKKIQSYARIIAVSDFLFSTYSQNIEKTIELLEINKDKKFDPVIVQKLVKKLSVLL